MDEQRWRDGAWLAGVRSWIDAELGRLGAVRSGDLDQRHLVRWSTVLRVPTDRGDSWFKANDDTLAHEGRVVEIVSELVPELVPPLLPCTASAAGCWWPTQGRGCAPSRRASGAWTGGTTCWAAMPPPRSR